jgi:myo-inositol-1(or 4)-monophosphatase
MASVNKDEILALALSIGKEAGELLSNRPDVLNVESKSTTIDIVTQMDKASEKLIVERILAARPDDGLIGEEGADRPSKSGITWVIDPLDGTVNYFYGLPGWNVSIAAKDADGVLVGVVTAPTIASTWHASRGGGAFRNGKKISCNDPVELNRAMIATGFEYDVEKRTKQLAQFSKLITTVRDLRRNGAAAVDLCNVAAGAIDGYYESGLHEWDLAAGGLIAQEAGALVTIEEHQGHQYVVAAGPALHASLKSALIS